MNKKKLTKQDKIIGTIMVIIMALGGIIPMIFIFKPKKKQPITPSTMPACIIEIVPKQEDNETIYIVEETANEMEV